MSVGCLCWRLSADGSLKAALACPARSVNQHISSPLLLSQSHCSYQLYLAAWGYNTAEERAAAAALPGVTVLRLPQMLELLRWGVVMGVDDGCEPTAEEAAENVR